MQFKEVVAVVVNADVNADVNVIINVVVSVVLFCISTSALALAIPDDAIGQAPDSELRNDSSQLIARSDFNVPEQSAAVQIRPFTDDANNYYKIETTFSIGVRRGDFDWNIASDFSGQNQPNTLSELSYTNLSITETSFDYQVRKLKGALKDIYFETHISAGYIGNGTIQDSDYDGDNRSQEFSRSLSNPEGSFTFNLINAVGLTKIFFDQWRVTPLLGYAYNVQSFVIREGEQVLATSRRTPSIGQFSGLDSTYQAQWFGFWLGLVTQADFNKHHFTLRGQFHFPEFYADANWNLRSDFAHPKSFAHFADGTAVSVKINYSYQLSKKLKFLASYHNERWETRDGIDTIYFEDGDTASTRLNETNWKSSSFSIGIVILTD
ncbi:MAG: hypothetical protein JKY67_19290 [Pseudomonadales bacterium]|nr:hypothetical protein [Pseudomonadales bacterium]